MKFIDGTWLVPDDLSVMHPLDVTDVRSLDGKLVARVAIKPQRTRGDQLNTGVFTLTLSSPREGIIGVRIEHFLGVPAGSPSFELNTAPADIRIRETDDVATLESGRLAVSVPRSGPFRLDFLRDGVRITGSVPKSAGRALERGSGLTHTFDRLDLSVGENVYGLGERFGAFVKNGQAVEMWNRDGGTSTDQAYKNIPFFLTSEGWGVFVDHPGRVEFEVASERSSKVQFSVPGERLEYYLIDGPSPKQVLTRYTALTGRPTLPPPWSFGLWLTTSFTTSYDEATVNSFVDGMQSRDIPLSVFHFDYAPLDIRVELVERLGSEAMVVFPMETPAIRSDQFGADAGTDDEQLFAGRRGPQAPFTARLEGNTSLEIGQAVRLGLRIEGMHFFDRKTGISLNR